MPTISSMTGYGKSSFHYNGTTYNLEARSVNSKFLDFRVKLPSFLAGMEYEIRKIAQEVLIRGKVEVLIERSKEEGQSEELINESLFKQYFEQLKKITGNYQIQDAEIVQSLMRVSAIYDTSSQEVEEALAEGLLLSVQTCLQSLKEHRLVEGASIAEDFALRIKQIAQCLQEVEPLEKGRILRLREKFQHSLEEHFGKQNYDENRLEQELIFYMEKLDITEEKTRLDQHLKYFQEVVEDPEISKGKKLGFIAQEIGREINTLGSKANASDIQKLVVQMKDELEKIKEQVANIV
jgi:uncharacterized protein (TIGR00255 family)